MVGTWSSSSYSPSSAPAVTLVPQVVVGTEVRVRLSADSASQCGNPYLGIYSGTAAVVLAWTCNSVCLNSQYVLAHAQSRTPGGACKHIL